MTHDSSLVLRGISKRFGSLQALTDVDVDFHAGEVHALLGENGAGKSTLMNIVYGLVQPDEGSLQLAGTPVRFEHPRAARAAGIGMVHQEFALVDALSVAENLALALSPARRLRCNLDKVAAAAGRLASEIGLDIPDPGRVVGTLPIGARQRLEILKALSGETRVLILDEPTAVLTPAETALLFQVLHRLRSRGVAVIFITHKLREVTAIADRVTVLRRGRRVATRRRGEFAEESLAQMMIGATVSSRQRLPHRPASAQAPALEVVDLCLGSGASATGLHGVALQVARGEVVGIAGVDGNGQSELFEVLVGLRAPVSGSIHVDGRPFARLDPATAMAAGIGHIPPDRQRQGLVLQASVQENTALNTALMRDLARGPFLPPASVRKLAQRLVSRYSIQVSDVEAPAATLSGGNQQRLVVARALALQPKALIAFNPTRGLDIAAARAVHEAIERALSRHTGVLLISTDLDEVLDLSDRISVLYRGTLSEPLRAPFSIERLGRLMTGLGDAGEPVVENHAAPQP